MILGHTVIEELPVGGKVFLLGRAGHQDFSSCSSCLLLRLSPGSMRQRGPSVQIPFVEERFYLEHRATESIREWITFFLL